MESAFRIEPTRLEDPTEAISDLVADLVSKTALLEKSLHSRTAFQLADLVRVTNTYHSNLIEGHNTRPLDIRRALEGKLDSNTDRRNLQLEAKAHYRVQEEIDQAFQNGQLPVPTSVDFIRKLHRDFYADAPEAMLRIHEADKDMILVPGEWRSKRDHDVQVGRHIPPSSESVPDFMSYFENAYDPKKLLTKTARITSFAISHHRLNYIHPFLDGNGRVSRLMSHAMAYQAGIGANGLWSISRGLSRGLKTRTEYKSMMDHADTPRQGDLDGRGNLSRKCTIEFVNWFLTVCLDQVDFMSSLFDVNHLSGRLKLYVEKDEKLKPETIGLLTEALIRGEIDRGEVSRISGLKDRTASRLLKDVIDHGLLSSSTAKGPLSLRFPNNSLEILFPRLFSEV